jgi:hypothetical protein
MFYDTKYYYYDKTSKKLWSTNISNADQISIKRAYELKRKLGMLMIPHQNITYELIRTK